MEFRDSMTVGVVVERRRIVHPWAEFSWTPLAVLPGAPPGEWRELRAEAGRAQFYAGSLELELFRKETASYKFNLESSMPRVWVALRRTGDDARPWRPHLVTVAPDEGQAATEGGEDIVDGVPMPEAIRAWVAGFVARHHVEEVFVKRQRQRHETAAPHAHGGERR
jgi:Protein of unknown function (DUF3305)